MSDEATAVIDQTTDTSAQDAGAQVAPDQSAGQQVAESQPAESQPAAWYDGINIRGVPWDRYQDPKDFARAAISTVQRLQQERETLRFQASQAAEYQRQLAELQAAQQQAAAKPKHTWEVPDYVKDYSPDWRSRVKYDEQGNLVAAPGEDPTLPIKLKQAREWFERQQADLFRDPASYAERSMFPILQERIEKMLDERLGETQSRIQQQLEARQILDAHKSLLYELDTLGQPMRAENGEYMLTETGQKVRQFIPLLQNAAASNDQQTMFNLAFLLATNGAGQAGGAIVPPAAGGAVAAARPAATPEAARDAANIEMLKRRAGARPQAVSSGGTGPGNNGKRADESLENFAMRIAQDLGL